MNRAYITNFHADVQPPVYSTTSQQHYERRQLITLYSYYTYTEDISAGDTNEPQNGSEGPTPDCTICDPHPLTECSILPSCPCPSTIHRLRPQTTTPGRHNSAPVSQLQRARIYMYTHTHTHTHTHSHSHTSTLTCIVLSLYIYIYISIYLSIDLSFYLSIDLYI
jgi:hypothetical protein